MRLFGYYALHSFANQLKKLFKTWVLVFIVACALLGGLIGLGVAVVADRVEGDEPEIAEEQTEEPTLLEKEPIIELTAGGVVLILFLFEAISADKNGSRIFLPADVTLLFSSPMKPQSVLMFRLLTQLGLALAASIYMAFQLPNLIVNLGMSFWAALAVIGAWALTLVVGKLLQVLLYTVSSTHAGIKNNMRRCVYLVIALLAAAFVLFWKRSGLRPLEAAQRFFNAPVSRYIPLWGWIKGFLMFAVEGRTAASLLCFAATAAACAALIFVIWNVKADFYEDAMAKSEETAELLERARSEKTSGLAVKKRKKDRSEKLRRDGLNRGAGANVYFYKSLYNRFRFAHFGFLTKTMETYLLAAAGVALLCRFVIGTDGVLPTAFALSAFAFFRALGNPLEQDTSMDCFVMIPEPAGKKLFWSLMGGTVNCLLDAFPALLLAAILLWKNPLSLLVWLPFIVSIDLYATTVGAFINLSVPVSAGKMVKQFAQVLFVYFGLIPDIVILVIGLLTGHTAVAAILAAVLNFGLGFLFFALCPHFIDPQDRRTNGETTEGTYVSASVNSEETLRVARRRFSFLGFGLTLYQAATLGIAAILSAVLMAVRPDWARTAWLWVVNFAPQYLVGLPLALLLFRQAPVFRTEKASLRPSVLIRAVFISIFFMIAGSLLGQLVNGLLGKLIGNDVVNPVEMLVGNDSVVLRILFAVIIGPLVEEFVFRKQLIGRMRGYGEKLAVVSSAALFALFHGNFSQVFYAFLLGLVFGYLYVRSGKLWYSCALHVFINFLGGVLSPLLLEKAGAAADIPLGSTDLSALSETALSGLIGLGVYEVFLFAAAAAGLVLLCLNAGKLRFAPAQLELPKERRFRTAWLNVGMLLFFVLSLGLFIMMLWNS